MDYETKMNGENCDDMAAESFEMEIGSGMFIDGFEDQLIGLSIGDTVEFNATFPEDYFNEKYAGKEVMFAVKVNAIKQMDAIGEEDNHNTADVIAGSEYDTGITYNDLARNPDDYEGKLVKFRGKVVQLVEDVQSNDITIRFAIDDDYDQMLFCQYDKSIVNSRVLEDDWITIYGISAGLISYKSTLGGTITIPAVYIEKIDQEF